VQRLLRFGTDIIINETRTSAEEPHVSAGVLPDVLDVASPGAEDMLPEGEAQVEFLVT